MYASTDRSFLWLKTVPMLTLEGAPSATRYCVPNFLKPLNPCLPLCITSFSAFTPFLYSLLLLNYPSLTSPLLSLAPHTWLDIHFLS